MTATVHVQPTVAPPAPTGPLTVPLQIVRAAGARHRVAVDAYGALPGWALAAIVGAAMLLIVFAAVAWRPLGSPLLIGCTLIGTAAMFGPDVLAAWKGSDR